MIASLIAIEQLANYPQKSLLLSASGSLSSILLRMLDEIFQVHISVTSDITAQPVEIRQPDYPIVALQQLARNAVMHRSYEGTNAPVRIY